MIFGERFNGFIEFEISNSVWYKFILADIGFKVNPKSLIKVRKDLSFSLFFNILSKPICT